MYKYLIDQMTWSYSRIRAFEDCPYGFLLKYIYNEEPLKLFFSEYGSFMHELIADLYTGNITKQDCKIRYLKEFGQRVGTNSPSPDIFSKFFSQGLECIDRLLFLKGEVESIEKEIRFRIGAYDLCGFIDCVFRDENNSLVILDHKSHDLKPRTNRKKPTVSDRELDEYLKQLYLYSIPISEEFGKAPDYLAFNCYRTGVFIKEKYQQEQLAKAKQWVTDTIARIKGEHEWRPNINSWRCRYICDLHHVCDYYRLAGR